MNEIIILKHIHFFRNCLLRYGPWLFLFIYLLLQFEQIVNVCLRTLAIARALVYFTLLYVIASFHGESAHVHSSCYFGHLKWEGKATGASWAANPAIICCRFVSRRFSSCSQSFDRSYQDILFCTRSLVLCPQELVHSLLGVVRFLLTLYQP